MTANKLLWDLLCSEFWIKDNDGKSIHNKRFVSFYHTVFKGSLILEEGSKNIQYTVYDDENQPYSDYIYLEFTTDDDLLFIENKIIQERTLDAL